MARVELIPLTSEMPDFAVADLARFLERHNPSDHLLPEVTSKEEPHVAFIHGHVNKILRWIDLEEPSIVDNAGGLHPDSVANHINLYELELLRLSKYGIDIPRHATYFAPNDPWQSQPLIYTAVERVRPRNPLAPPHKITSLHHLHYQPFMRVIKAATQYYLEDATAGLYISEAYLTEQYNRHGTLMDLDPQLTGREWCVGYALSELLRDSMRLPMTTELALLQRQLKPYADFY